MNYSTERKGRVPEKAAVTETHSPVNFINRSLWRAVLSREARGESDGKFPAHREERLMDNKHDKELRASAEKPASDKEEKEKRGDDEERALKGCVKMDQRS